ncbi:MAG: hypothetical protein V4549_09305 [Bacteroidota bacterium]
MSRFKYTYYEYDQPKSVFTSINELLFWVRNMPDELKEEIISNFSEAPFTKLDAKTFISKNHPVKIVRDYVVRTETILVN